MKNSKEKKLKKENRTKILNRSKVDIVDFAVFTKLYTI
jgi:hypothetical protein